ncbi:MAG: hypothetical protein WD875_07355 [Pirellulales bacterium]
MTTFWSRSGVGLAAVAAALVAFSAWSIAAPREKSSAAAGETAKVDAAKVDTAAGEAIDVFDAIKSEQVDVKFIAVSANKANLIVENKTKKPLTIKLPEAFAGVPVLAQFAAGAGQDVGGGGGPAFNIAPEKTHKVELAVLCLDHGKPDPTARMPYELKPISAVSDKPEVSALLVRYGKGDVATKAAQAAAWHLENGMSWQELAGKNIEDPRGLKSPYFTKREIAQGMKLADGAVAFAKEHAAGAPGFESFSPGAKASR